MTITNKQARREQVLSLASKVYTQRAIAQELNVSTGLVNNDMPKTEGTAGH